MTQLINTAGIKSTLSLLLSPTKQHLLVPHIHARSLNEINWEQLKQAGFKGLVFDKDNTLTSPFSHHLHPTVALALQKAIRTFPDKIVVFSNSAGLYQYDPNGAKAQALEDALNLPVLRHRHKKPSGDASELEQQLQCEAHEMVMIGDRCLTDVVFGNKHGMLTVLTTALEPRRDPWVVRIVRAWEHRLLRRLARRDVMPPVHSLWHSK